MSEKSFVVFDSSCVPTYKKASIAVLLGSSIFLPMHFSAPAFAAAGGTVPADVQTGINNAQATVTALSPLALACLVVALTPMGAMLTLRFLNMVLSRV